MEKVNHIHGDFQAICLGEQVDQIACDINNDLGVYARWGKCIEDANNDPDKFNVCVQDFEDDSSLEFLDRVNKIH